MQWVPISHSKSSFYYPIDYVSWSWTLIYHKFRMWISNNFIWFSCLSHNCWSLHIQWFSKTKYYGLQNYPSLTTIQQLVPSAFYRTSRIGWSDPPNTDLQEKKNRYKKCKHVQQAFLLIHYYNYFFLWSHHNWQLTLVGLELYKCE